MNIKMHILLSHELMILHDIPSFNTPPIINSRYRHYAEVNYWWTMKPRIRLTVNYTQQSQWYSQWPVSYNDRVDRAAGLQNQHQSRPTCGCQEIPIIQPQSWGLAGNKLPFHCLLRRICAKRPNQEYIANLGNYSAHAYIVSSAMLRQTHAHCAVHHAQFSFTHHIIESRRQCHLHTPLTSHFLPQKWTEMWKQSQWICKVQSSTQ